VIRAGLRRIPGPCLRWYAPPVPKRERNVGWRVFRASLCLVVGALVTFAIAAVATQQVHSLPSASSSQTGVIAWPRRMPEGWPPHATRLALGRYPACVTLYYSATGSRLFLLRVEGGWPAHAMRFDMAPLAGGPAGHDGWQIGKRTVIPRNLLWPGFALDTAFYGTLAFLLWSAPGFVKRTRRRRRRLCVACGYELRGMQKCPECGGDRRANFSTRG
jgi:hypothetical protein